MASSENSVSHQFDKLLQRVQGKAPTEASLKTFDTLKTDKERVSFFLDNELYDDVLKVGLDPLQPEKKSDAKAEAHRTTGNELFQAKQFEEALKEFNKSVLYAASCESGTPSSDTLREVGGSRLSFAFANRSAALFFLGEYCLCLVDIARALELDYPETLHYKLYERKGKSLIKIGQHAEAKIAFIHAKETLARAALDDKERKTWVSNIDKGVKRCDKVKNPPMGEDVSKAGILRLYAKHVKGQIPKIDGNKSDKFAGAASSFGLKHSPEGGRYAYATQNIHIGSVIALDTPFASVCFPTFWSEHCQECLKEVRAPVACHHCSSVVFCNESCRKTAWSKFHQYECQIMDGLRSPWVGRMGHASLRLVLVAGLEEVLQQAIGSRPEEEEEQKLHSMNDGTIDGSFPRDYRSICAMVANSKMRCSGTFFEFSVMAVYLLNLLRQSGFIPEKTNAGEENAKSASQPADQLRCLGGVLLRHLQIVQCNAQEIAKMVQDGKPMPQPISIGLGIYPIASLLNRSCASNADFNYHNGHTCVIRAVGNIPEGETMFEDYGLSYCVMPKDDRQNVCKSQYFFTCTCRACTNDWPTWPEMPKEIPVFRCFTCGDALPKGVSLMTVKCTACKEETNLSEFLQQLQESHQHFAKAMKSFHNGDLKGAIPGLKYHLSLLQCYIAPPWQEMATCESALKHCYRMQGNKAVEIKL